MIIDATNQIVGRLGTFVAKKALLGEKIDVVNAEKAMISGRREVVFKKYKHRTDVGSPHWGPKFPKTPDRFLRRAIRGMLSHKKPRGKEAFKRIMCHIGVPKKFEGKKFETVKTAEAGKGSTKYITVFEVTQYLKGK